MKNEKKPLPLIIAHRGASALAPENTLSAFLLAYELGADGIELDVMHSADDELVVIHDAIVSRTTNGLGKVNELSYAALREFDAGSKFGESFTGEHLPTLTEVFEALGGKLLINVELKNHTHPFNKLTQHVITLVEQMHLEGSVLLSSFNPLNLRKARKLNPHIKLGLLSFPKNKLMNGPVGRFFPYDALHPYFSDVDEAMVTELHELGRQVNTWTVDDPAELKRLQALGVDAVICNNPGQVRKVLEGNA